MQIITSVDKGKNDFFIVMDIHNREGKHYKITINQDEAIAVEILDKDGSLVEGDELITMKRDESESVDDFVKVVILTCINGLSEI